MKALIPGCGQHWLSERRIGKCWVEWEVAGRKQTKPIELIDTVDVSGDDAIIHVAADNPASPRSVCSHAACGCSSG